MHVGLRGEPDYLNISFVLVGSFEIKGGLENANSFLRKLKVFSLAECPGGISPLAEHAATISHASMPEDFKGKTGITDDPIRLSVGLGNGDDLIEDLGQALNRK